jgi:hypothetical protein
MPSARHGQKAIPFGRGGPGHLDSCSAGSVLPRQNRTSATGQTRPDSYARSEPDLRPGRAVRGFECGGKSEDACTKDQDCLWGEGCSGPAVQCARFATHEECSVHSACFGSEPPICIDVCPARRGANVRRSAALRTGFVRQAFPMLRRTFAVAANEWLAKMRSWRGILTSVLLAVIAGLPAALLVLRADAPRNVAAEAQFLGVALVKLYNADVAMRLGSCPPALASVDRSSHVYAVGDASLRIRWLCPLARARGGR